jgi:hypothetical protein
MVITITITEQEVIDAFCKSKGYTEVNPLTQETKTKEEFIKEYFVNQLKGSYSYKKRKEVEVTDVSDKIS